MSAKEIKTVYDLLRTKPIGGGFGVTPAKEKAPMAVPTLPSVGEIEEGQFTPLAKTPAGVTPNTHPPITTASASMTDQYNSVVLKHPVGAKFNEWFKKDLIKYGMIFVMLAIVLYGIINIGALIAKIAPKFQKKEPHPQTTNGQVLGVSTLEYQQWIKKYFYTVNNPDAISPNADFDRDGLSNYQEFLLYTNPTKRSTPDDGVVDGQRILNGQNPLTGGRMSEEQKRIIKDWNLQEINNRLSYYAITSVRLPNSTPITETPPIVYDLEREGEVSVPKLGIKAPLIWSVSADDFAKDLERGVIHYPASSLPGQIGVAYISGHSSNYVWKNQTYAQVFARLDELVAGDEFFVSVYTAAGEKLNFRYVVFSTNKYQPDDEAQFASAAGEARASLSTCWPLGSTAKRYVVSGKLTGV